MSSSPKNSPKAAPEVVDEEIMEKRKNQVRLFHLLAAGGQRSSPRLLAAGQRLSDNGVVPKHLCGIMWSHKDVLGLRRRQRLWCVWEVDSGVVIAPGHAMSSLVVPAYLYNEGRAVVLLQAKCFVQAPDLVVSLGRYRLL